MTIVLCLAAAVWGALWLFGQNPACPTCDHYLDITDERGKLVACTKCDG